MALAWIPSKERFGFLELDRDTLKGPNACRDTLFVTLQKITLLKMTSAELGVDNFLTA